MVEQSYPYNSYSGSNNRKYLIRGAWAAVALVIVVIIIIIINSLSKGSLVVNTNSSKNIVSVTKDLSDQQTSGSASTTQTNGHLSTKLSPGSYTVTVQNQYFSAQQTVNIRARHTSTVNLKLSKLSYLQPVTSFDTHDLLATNNFLEYIDPSTGYLYMVDNNNNLTNVNGSYSFQNVQWDSSGAGIAQSSNGQYFVVNGSSINPLNTGSVPLSTNSFFTISPNGTVYISVNYALYRGTLSGGFTKIDSLSDSAPYLVAGNDAVAVFEGGADGISKVSGEVDTKFFTINTSGQIHTLDGDAYEAAWSPNGQYLITTDDGGTYIYNTSLKQVGNVPNKNINAPTWLNNTTIFYGVSSGLWEYNLLTKQAHAVSTSALNGSVSEINPSKDGEYVYVLTVNQAGSSPTYQLSRFGLNGQSTSTRLGELQVFLPNSVNGCGMNYLNFEKLSIVVTGSGSQEQNCLQQAQTYLTNYGLSTSGLSFSYIPINTD
jgi:hypothetical protein